VRRLIGLLLFLVFVDEDNAAYKTRMFSPMAWVHDWLLEPTAIKVRPFDLAMLAILLVATTRKNGGGPSVAPMRNTMFLALATTVLWFFYGLSRGGETRFASWQTYLLLSSILTGFTIAATFRTPDHFAELGKWLVGAAMYRALMCWISYFTWGRDTVGQMGAFLTNHDDTICWVTGILVLLLQAIDRRTTRITIRNALMICFLLGAIQFNSRRLAWVSLALGLLVMYVLFPGGPAKRVVRRAARYALPVLVVYVVVGWGRPNKIFLPLHSFSTISTEEDASTLARNAENLSLIATANYAGSVLGTGWGRPYAVLTRKYDIAGSFELWQYVPHNSILGLLAFTGILGFSGFWIALPTAVFFNARVARLGKTSPFRNAGMIGVAQLIVCANQLYGDMGIFSLQVMYVVAASYAMALRLPVTAGVWNRPTTKAQMATPSPG
jgi:hypothetical protein